jgi:apolipoprotein N-acyltransferase
MTVALCCFVEKIPLSAIQEGIEAFRNIVVLEQRRARQQAARVASRQGMRGALLVLGAAMLAFAIHLAFFWVTVALYQRGWSIGPLILAVLGFGVIFAGLCYAIGKSIVRRASIKSIVRTSYERHREDRERAGSRKEAA